jgi:AraC-like DNA-binding protein/mannose-6-phosphate isomerase-like protein (cupin superfamily)
MKPHGYFRKANIDYDSEVNIFVNRFRENYNGPLHFHDALEINYIAEGHGFHFVNNEVIPVVSGDIFIIPVGTTHVFRPSTVEGNPPLIVYNCLFHTEQLQEWCQSIPHPFEANHFFASTGQSYYRFHDNGQVRLIFDQLYQEFIQHRPGYKTILIMRIIELMILLFRFEHDSLPRGSSPAPQRLDAVFSYIRANFHLPLTLEQMAGMVFLSASHFHRLFKQTTGQTFVEYLQNVRIEESCRLLRTTELKIQDITARVGYQDTQFFLHLFKKKTGVTPREYRKQPAI